MRGRGRYRLREILADFREEFVIVRGLANEVDKEVVSCCEFCMHVVSVTRFREVMFLQRSLAYLFQARC